MSPVVDVVRTYLELRSPEQLHAAYTNDPRIRFVRHTAVSVEHYRQLYRAVGDQWYWHDRNVWPDARVESYFASPSVFLWECLVGDESAGYFELERHADSSVEVVYFGLAAPFIGRGLGKVMLTRAVEEAWALGPSRVWLHTCTLDSPHALPNYKARGFEEVRTETYVMQLPEPA